MKKRMMFAAALLLCAGGLAAVALQSAGSTGILYRVTGEAGEMYILGSIHVGGEGMNPMGRHIRRAIDEADVLIFECDTNGVEARSAMQGMMFLPEGEDLSRYLDEGLRDSLERASAAAGQPMEAMERFRPWAATSVLTNFAAQNAMGGSRPGVEEMVARLGRGRETAYLETAQEQLAVLDSLSPALQMYLLSSACQQVLEPTLTLEHLRSWPEWWTAGDADAFAVAYAEEYRAEAEPTLADEYHARLVTERNRRMALGLDAWLKSGRKCFVTVGLMHLVLEGDSILSELQGMGYEVTRVK